MQRKRKYTCEGKEVEECSCLSIIQKEISLVTINPNLLRAFGDEGARQFSDKNWLKHIYEGSNKTRFECCDNSKHSWMHIRAIQRHIGGNRIAPELLGDVTIPYNWKECVFHRGCSFNINSILETGLIAGGRESKEGRQNIFLTPLNPFRENLDEEAPGDDLSIPRKVHYQSNWKHDQDAVCWVKLSRAQDQGLRFWQTTSHAMIVHNLVPADCIYRVMSQKGDRTLPERLPTLRPAPGDS